MWAQHDEESDRYCLGLSVIAENGMKVDVATGGYIYP